MTLRHLEILKAVAETRNFTKAAQSLYITQSAVSHAIRELEEEAGTVLFDRMKKRVRITESGRMLLEESLPFLTSFNALEARLGQLESRAPLHIASSIIIASFWLPGIIRRFEQLWPGLPVQVEVRSAAGALGLLQAGTVDLALIEGTLPDGPFACIPFSSYELKLVCSPEFTKKGPTTVQELCELPLLLREKGSAIRDTFDSALYLRGFTARPRWISVNSTALLEAAKAGLGVTILPDVLVQEPLAQGELTLLTVPELSLCNQMTAVHNTQMHAGAPLRDFIALFSELA